MSRIVGVHVHEERRRDLAQLELHRREQAEVPELAADLVAAVGAADQRAPVGELGRAAGARWSAGCPSARRSPTATAAGWRASNASRMASAREVTERPGRRAAAGHRRSSLSAQWKFALGQRSRAAVPSRHDRDHIGERPAPAAVPPRGRPSCARPSASPTTGAPALRAPLRTPVDLPHRLTEVTGPVLGEDRVTAAGRRPDPAQRRRGRGPADPRLRPGARQRRPPGARRAGRGLAGQRRPAATGTSSTTGPAPLDPHFDGLGRVVTDSLGRYEFMTIKPGAYPWGNHHNAWRPAHIHFSLFGRAFTQRLVTQMYFPDDPLFGQDPIFNAIPAAARHRAISRFDLERTQDNWALAFEWDIVLRGHGPDAVRDRGRRRCAR